MELKVVGAGLGRTGTLSLKLALEQLLAGPCYHMMELFAHREHVSTWAAAARGERVDWHSILAPYTASVDWPASAFWPEISAAFPDALVLLSHRGAEAWWRSASETIFPSIREVDWPEWRAMLENLFRSRFTWDLDDHDAVIAAYEAHNRRVRETVSPDRLLEWSPGDGWEPICDRLGLEVPQAAFPHVNTRQEFHRRRQEEADGLGR